MPAAVPVYADAFPQCPALEEALSHALLDEAGLGLRPAAVRLAVPGSLVSFGRLDALAPGFPDAVAAARAAGYAAVHRLVGGRAAVFNDGAILFTHVVAEEHPSAGTHDRFRWIAGMAERALRRLGVDARIGQVPGEYCPGDFSLNAGGRIKVAGIAQRVTRRAACTQGVLVVEDAERVRAVLEPVYAALALDWDPATAGAVEDVAPGVGTADVLEALRAEFERELALEPARLPAETLARAEVLAGAHDAESPVARDPGAGKVLGGPGL